MERLPESPRGRDRGVRVLARGATGYPPGLLDLSDAPPELYVAGGLPAGPAAAIVGSRAASPYGIAFARRLAADLAGCGVVVVSGLARGIDAAAHEGALEAGGLTVAVVPSGLEAVTPPHHEPLAARIAGSGALASEIAAGPPFGRGAFIERNRLIAAMTDVTVVVEAAERSGALSTAAAARRLGREVLAVPGDVDRPTARGTLGLLRTGARPCGAARDVLDAIARRSARALGASDPASRASRVPAPDGGRAGARAGRGSRAAADGAIARLAGDGSAVARPDADVVARWTEDGAAARPEADIAARLAAALGDEPRGLERLASAAGTTPGHALALLLRLEWAGLARAVPGQRWVRPGP